MSEMDLSREDVALLFDALEAWKARGFGGKMMGGLFKALASKGNPEAQAKFEADQAAEDLKDRKQQRDDAERAVMVQAKLVYLRDRMEIESATKVPS